jgi:RNA polymerase sigma factor (sigma-70 family)
VTALASTDELIVLANVRLDREYRDRHRRLMAWARGFDWLSAEDREDLASDTLIAWYRELRTRGVEFDDTFCGTVLRREAIDRLRRCIWERVHTVDLAQIEEIGIDPELDARVGEREAARQLWALARELLSGEELRMLGLVTCGYRRREVSRQVGLSEQDVKRSLLYARRKLRAARDQDPRLAA